MAVVLPKFSGRRLSQRRNITYRVEPAIGLRLLALQHALEPGEQLEFQYCLQRVSADQIDRLELSVAWYTEGKGSDDIGVHFFKSHGGHELGEEGITQRRVASTLLPANPLSYEGRLFKIRWCVRLRLFLNNGREISTEQPFYLGHLTSEI